MFTFFRNILEDWKVLAILLLRCKKKKKKAFLKTHRKYFSLMLIGRKITVTVRKLQLHCNCKKENAKKQEENILQDSLEARLRCEEFWVSSAGWSL